MSNDDDFLDSLLRGTFGRQKVLFRCLKCGLRQADKAGETCVACIMEEMRQFANDAGGPTTFDRARYARADDEDEDESPWTSSQRRAVPPPAKPAAVDPEADMLRRLIYLCHPDKHANSLASQIATKYLLDLKAKGK